MRELLAVVMEEKTGVVASVTGTTSDDTLLPIEKGEYEGRAAFFDLSLDGRWGGVISGDKVSVRYGKCDCGHQGPTIGYDIVRYSDLGDGDKITCAGSQQAYNEFMEFVAGEA